MTVQTANACYQLRKRRRVSVEVTVPGRRAAMSAELSELSADRVVLLVPRALEIGQAIDLHVEWRKPEAELTGGGEVRWVWFTPDRQRRVVCDLDKKLSPELLEAICGAGLLEPCTPSTRRLPVEVDAQWELEPSRMVGTIEAFSSDGFYFVSPQPPKQGGRLLVILHPDGGEPLQLPARSRCQQRLSKGYLLQCTFESARGYEQLGNYIYPLATPSSPAPRPVEPTLSTFSQCGIVLVLYLSWFARICS